MELVWASMVLWGILAGDAQWDCVFHVVLKGKAQMPKTRDVSSELWPTYLIFSQPDGCVRAQSKPLRNLQSIFLLICIFRCIQRCDHHTGLLLFARKSQISTDGFHQSEQLLNSKDDLPLFFFSLACLSWLFTYQIETLNWHTFITAPKQDEY